MALPEEKKEKKQPVLSAGERKLKEIRDKTLRMQNQEKNKVIIPAFLELNFQEYADTFNKEFYKEMQQKPNLSPNMFEKSDSYEKLLETIYTKLFELVGPQVGGNVPGYSVTSFRDEIKIITPGMEKLFKPMNEHTKFTKFLLNISKTEKTVDYGFRFKFKDESHPGNSHNKKIEQTKINTKNFANQLTGPTIDSKIEVSKPITTEEKNEKINWYNLKKLISTLISKFMKNTASDALKWQENNIPKTTNVKKSITKKLDNSVDSGIGASSSFDASTCNNEKQPLLSSSAYSNGSTM